MKATIALAALQQGGLTENERREAADIIRYALAYGLEKQKDADALATLVMQGDNHIRAARGIRVSLGCRLHEALLAADRIRNLHNTSKGRK